MRWFLRTRETVPATRNVGSPIRRFVGSPTPPVLVERSPNKSLTNSVNTSVHKLADYTVGGELHPAPKIDMDFFLQIVLLRILLQFG